MRSLILGFVLIAANLQAALVCSTTAATPVLHAEGLTRQAGDIVLSCAGGVPGTAISGNLSIYLSTNVTNKVSAQNFADAILTVDTGNGPTSAGSQAQILGVNQLGFNGLAFTVPGSGAVTLRISNIRVAAGVGAEQAVLSLTAPAVTLTNPSLSIGIFQPSLLASILTGTVASQQGSPLPDNVSFSMLLATGTRFATTRITEAAFGSFQPRQPMTDNGMRIVSRYSNFPAGTRLFVPDAIARDRTQRSRPQRAISDSLLLLGSTRRGVERCY